MAQGGQSKGLIIASKTAGWDPTRIYDPATGKYEESIENFDKQPEIFKNQAGTGRLPQGTPDSFPGEQPLKERVSWNAPDTRRETRNRATRGANPAPRRPGAGG